MNWREIFWRVTNIFDIPGKNYILVCYHACFTVKMTNWMVYRGLINNWDSQQNHENTSVVLFFILLDGHFIFSWIITEPQKMSCGALIFLFIWEKKRRRRRKSHGAYSLALHNLFGLSFVLQIYIGYIM